MAVFNLNLSQALRVVKIPDTKKGGILRSSYLFDLVALCPGLTNGDQVNIVDSYPFSCTKIYGRKQSDVSAADLVSFYEPTQLGLIYLPNMPGFATNTGNLSNTLPASLATITGGICCGDQFRCVINMVAVSPTAYRFSIDFEA